MDNKETLQRHNVRLNENNIDIDNIINIIENLPEEPSGTLEITENGEYDVFEKAIANVNVPVGVFPEGNIDITTTEEYDVTNYMTAKIKDDNLKAENIAENVEILGLKGTFKGGIDTSDATATSDDLLLGKTAYVNEEKLTGTIKTWDGTFEGDAERYQPLNDYLRGIKTEITADDMANVRVIRKYQFYYSPITSIEIPSCITQIENYAFSQSAITSVVLPDSVTSLGNAIFENAYSLKTLVLPKNITQISNNLCFRSKGLEKIEIPEKVTKIGARAFNQCDSLTEMICRPTTPPTLDSTSLSLSTTGYVIKVPAGSVEAYKSATNWSIHADYIVAYEEV